MFVDEVKIQVAAGTGGNGVATFRREKYIPRGGPDGGDGGRGGSVYLVADPDLTTLLDFRYHHRYKAQHGGHGQRANKHGKDAPDLLLKVPVGTLVQDTASGEVMGDLASPDQRLRVAAGGRGGRGNARFASATNQAPRFAENGEPGEEREIHLELKLLADVGLVGLPNAGKSSLLNRISAAHPKIADYPFTTLVPILGVVSLGDHRSCVVADIPGLIEGAHQGLGLGHQFLRHIERTRMLIHVLDSAGESEEEVLLAFDVVNRELESYNPRLLSLKTLVALNKTDIALAEQVEALRAALTSRGYEAYPISAATGAGIERLLYRVGELLPAVETATPAQATPAEGEERVEIGLPASRRPSRRWTIERDEDGAYRVTGEGLERLVAMTNVQNESALERLHRTLDRAGVLSALRAQGVQDGDVVRIRNTEFVFVEEERMFRPRSRRKQREARA